MTKLYFSACDKHIVSLIVQQFLDDMISMGECNTILSAYTKCRHLG